MVPQRGIELQTDAYKATVIPFNYKGVIGLSGWIRTSDILLPKQVTWPG